MTASIARRAIVRGRVQGVWYRASTREQALALGVEGYALNRDDGTVEVLAVGHREAVEALLSWLWEGPPLAQVTGVDVSDADPAASPQQSGFTTG